MLRLRRHIGRRDVECLWQYCMGKTRRAVGRIREEREQGAVRKGFGKNRRHLPEAAQQRDETPGRSIASKRLGAHDGRIMPKRLGEPVGSITPKRCGGTVE